MQSSYQLTPEEEPLFMTPDATAPVPESVIFPDIDAKGLIEASLTNVCKMISNLPDPHLVTKKFNELAPVAESMVDFITLQLLFF